MLVGPFEADVLKYDGEAVTLQFCECHPEETFKVALNIGAMPLLEFAHAAESGLDTARVEGMAALYSMLKDCIDPSDWNHFRQIAKDHKSSEATLMKAATNIWAALSNRPLESASFSEDGPQSPSTGSSSSEPVSDSSSTPTVVGSKKPVHARSRRKVSGSTSSA